MMPKVPPNFAPPETSFQTEANSVPQITASKKIIEAPPTNKFTELSLPSTSATLEALHQVLPQTTKRKRKSPNYYGFENDDSSGEFTSSCPPNFGQPRRKRRAGDVESEQPSVIQIIVDTAAQVEPIPNAFTSPVIGEVSPTDPCLRPANQSPPDELIIDEEDM